MHPGFATKELNSHGKLLREGNLIFTMMAKAWGFIPGSVLYRGGLWYDKHGNNIYKLVW